MLGVAGLVDDGYFGQRRIRKFGSDEQVT